jgi:predicted nucleic acid-binding Zn ribbon protein
MERAGRAIANLKLSGKVAPQDLAVAAWPAAVGPRLAARAIAVGLVRSTLIVEVEDAVWQKQLFQLRTQILRKLRAVVGEELIQDVEFRIGVKRRPPQTASTISAPTADDADSIEDPILRRVYKQSRKKASA